MPRKKVSRTGRKVVSEASHAGNWLVNNRKPRNYIFYAANLALLGNPFSALVGLAGRVYEDFLGGSKQNSYLNLARLGLGVLTVLDTADYGGILETLGDITLATSLLTDTSYFQEKSLRNIGGDCQNVVSGVKGLVGKMSSEDRKRN